MENTIHLPFSVSFKTGELRHYPGNSFASQDEAQHFAEQGIMENPNYDSAVISDRGFEILNVEG